MSGGPDILTQAMPVIPGHVPFSHWTHYYPILVEALAAHGEVPEQEVVDHLNELFRETANDPNVLPLDRQAAALNRYLNEYVS